jgi:hypothetical protein
LTFVPVEPDEPNEPVRSTFKRTKRRNAERAPNLNEPAEEPTKRKKRKPLAKIVVQAPKWFAWIDPASLLWLPLPIVLAVFIGSALFSLILPPVGNQDGVVNINIIFLTFSTVLAFLPFAFLLSHWMEIGGAWAQGNTADPPFPDFDLGAILGDFFSAIPAVLFAAAFSGSVYLLPMEGVWKSALAAWLFAIYSALSLMAVSLQSHALASNPISILLALFRMTRGRLAFFVESACHLAIGFGLWKAIFLVWEKNWDVGILIWAVLWVFVFFSGARLMRAVGVYYRRNANRVGWFS